MCFGAQFLECDNINKILEIFPQNDQRLEIHSSGTLDSNKWNPAFQNCFGEDEWEIKGTMTLSKYANKVYESEAKYFRVVEENGKTKVRYLGM